MTTYKTTEVATIIGIHPNTVRLYEKLELIPKAERLKNGYRVFTDFHIEQCKLIRVAFQVEVLQHGLRGKIVKMIKVAATGDFDAAIQLTQEYLKQISQERINAEEAIEIVKQLLIHGEQKHTQCLRRKEVSEALDISMDTLRNWEMNGLLSVKRKDNGYRVYTSTDIARLKMIRALRLANYSLEAILRMLTALEHNPQADMKQVLNTPQTDADIISVCDRLIVSLRNAEENAERIIHIIVEMKKKFS